MKTLTERVHFDSTTSFSCMVWMERERYRRPFNQKVANEWQVKPLPAKGRSCRCKRDENNDKSIIINSTTEGLALNSVKKRSSSRQDWVLSPVRDCPAPHNLTDQYCFLISLHITLLSIVTSLLYFRLRIDKNKYSWNKMIFGLVAQLENEFLLCWNDLKISNPISFQPGSFLLRPARNSQEVVVWWLEIYW